jgi:hypothetical protein
MLSLLRDTEASRGSEASDDPTSRVGAALVTCPNDRVGSSPSSVRPCATVSATQPDLGHEVTSCELGQDPSVDLVGLGGEWGDALYLGRVRVRDIPASELESVVDEGRPGHRLDRRAHLLTLPQDVDGQRPERAGVRADGGHRPSSSSTCTSSLWRDRSNPAYNMSWASWCWLLVTTQRCHQRGPSS